MTVNDLTVEQFQHWYKILHNNKLDSLEKQCWFYSIIKNIHILDAEKVPMREIIKVVKPVFESKPSDNIKRFVMLGTKPYVALLNAQKIHDQLSANQFMAAQMYSRTEADAIENMHKLLALIYAPYKFGKIKISKDQNLTAERFLKAKIGEVYGGVFFYSRVWEMSQPILQRYTNEAVETIASHMEEVKAHGLDLQKGTAGITR